MSRQTPIACQRPKGTPHDAAIRNNRQRLASIEKKSPDNGSSRAVDELFGNGDHLAHFGVIGELDSPITEQHSNLNADRDEWTAWVPRGPTQETPARHEAPNHNRGDPFGLAPDCALPIKLSDEDSPSWSAWGQRNQRGRVDRERTTRNPAELVSTLETMSAEERVSREEKDPRRPTLVGAQTRKIQNRVQAEARDFSRRAH